jgi:tight adherence protein C
MLVALAAPLVLLLPYAATTGRLPTIGVLFLLAVGGFFVPDLALRSDVRRRQEAIFLDLPEVISVLALALGAGQSLRQALELAARDCPGPLGEELTRALSLARRERTLGERAPRKARTSSSCASRRARRGPSRTATSSAPPTGLTSPCTHRSRRSSRCWCSCSPTASFASSPRPSSA